MPNNNQTYLVTASIFIGLLLVAAAFFLSEAHTTSGKNVDHNQLQQLAQTGDPRREGAYRNVYGNPDAEITIVEFSDYECPFCVRAHATIKKIVDESDRKINWEYRHLPLDIHHNALPGAIAAECVAQHLGNDAFWKYSDTIFHQQHSLSSAFFEQEAVGLGMVKETYESCIASEDVQHRVQNDVHAAHTFGANGTPHSIVYFADGSSRMVRGALPYDRWIQVLTK